MPPFAFVNVAHPGDVKQHSTTIRKHVMKDIGIARRRPQKKDRRGRGRGRVSEKSLDIIIAENEQDSPSEDPEPESESYLAPWAPLSDGKLNSLVYPMDMNDNRLQLVHYLVEEARVVFKPFRFAWLSMSVGDPAAWDITLANATLFSNLPLGSAKVEFFREQEAFNFYVKSLNSIYTRLNDEKERDSEGIILAVTGHICHDTSVGNFNRWQVHMSGLKKLVTNRGGLEKLSHPFLRLMISWLDLTGSSFLNIPPTFELPEGTITQIDTRDETKDLDNILKSLYNTCPILEDIGRAMRATAAVSAYINQHSSLANFWRDDVRIARLLAPALHVILSLDGWALPEDPYDAQYYAVASREAFRRAALIFLGAIKIHLGTDAPDIPIHVSAFREISKLQLVQWSTVAELSLWAHIISAMYEDSEEIEWYVATIVSMMASMGLRTGEQAFEVARRMIWVHDVGADRAEILRQRIDCYLVANNPDLDPQSMPVAPHVEVPHSACKFAASYTNAAHLASSRASEEIIDGKVMTLYS